MAQPENLSDKDRGRILTVEPLSIEGIARSGGVSGVHGVHSGSAPNHLSGVPHTAINIFISFVGAGLLGLPSVFSRSGVAESILCGLLVSPVCIISMLILVDCKRVLRDSRSQDVTTLGDLAQAALGDVGRRIVNVLLALTQCCFSTSYLIFIASNVHTMAPETTTKPFIILVCLPGLVTLGLLRHMKQLANFSLVADVAIMVGVLSVVLFDYDHMKRHARESRVLPYLLDDYHGWRAIPFLFGIFVYCFEGVGMLLPLESSMANPRMFNCVFLSTIGLVVFIYIGFGSLGAMAFGHATLAPITLNLPPDSRVSAIVKCALCIGLYFTHPIMLFPVFEMLESQEQAEEQQSADDHHGDPMSPRVLQIACVNPFGKDGRNRRRNLGKIASLATRRNIRRMGIVVLTGVVATIFPYFDLFMSFVGSSCCCFLVLLFPAIVRVALLKDRLSWPSLLATYALGLLGILGSILGTVDSVRLIRRVLQKGSN